MWRPVLWSFRGVFESSLNFLFDFFNILNWDSVILVTCDGIFHSDLQEIRTTKERLLLSWDNHFWLAGAEDPTVIRDQHLWGKTFWEMFPQGKYKEAVIQRDQGYAFCWCLILMLLRLSEVVLVLKAWRDHRELKLKFKRTGESAGAGAASIAVEAPGLRG